MIFITGDCHSEFDRFSVQNFPEQKEMTKDDYVIICGDFGGIWNKDFESPKERFKLDLLDKKPFTTLFVCGNHENFDRLYSYPVVEWHGGKVHQIRKSVLHLMRGQVFELFGKKLFAFGGASCHDIQGGLLDPEDPGYERKAKQLQKYNIFYRVKHRSWWEQELPSEEEMAEGIRNLEANDYTVDFIVTHCCSTTTQNLLDLPTYTSDRLTDYLDEIRHRCKFKWWFFGHYHDNKYVNAKEILIYEQIVQIA